MVKVEVDIANGLPNLLIVGLPGAAVQESRERVRAALQNSGLPFPLRRVVINLAPADVRKEGPSFDLPIALALLSAQQAIPRQPLSDLMSIGELALDGALRPVRGALSIGLLASKSGIPRLLVPPANAAEVAAIGGVEVLAPRSLGEAVSYLRGTLALTPVEPRLVQLPASGPDFEDVKGQAAAKRALEVAASGGHNVLMTGPPGAGKTMLASRLPGIMPDLTPGEAIETTSVHSAAGIPSEGLLVRPPFRSPHHTVSHAGLVGGGASPRPGEVSLAHNGVLFMDEFGEFARSVLEVLRQPLEDGVVTISRARGSLAFPARFLLVASRNPCPCGYHGDASRACICSISHLQRYRQRISGPLLDRIDISLNVPRMPAQDLLKSPTGEKSSSIRERVECARTIALERQGCSNARLAGSALRLNCTLDAAAEKFARHAITRLSASARAFDRMLKVARTIADLQRSARIREEHLAEAAGYRHGNF